MTAGLECLHTRAVDSKMRQIRITAYDHNGYPYRVNVEVPKKFTEEQARVAACNVLDKVIVRVAFN
jgi:hypothetical protein